MTYSSLRALLMKRFDIPKTRHIRRSLRSFTPAEKAIFYFFVGLFILSGSAMLLEVNRAFLVEVPLRGGSLTEGVIGNPRFINPVLSISEADKNLVSLVYSGLVRVTPQGEIVNDLADSVTVSEDGLTYTAHIKSDAVFHDGTPVTSGDVVYTVEQILNPGTKSPHFSTWSGITVEAVDDKTVLFHLKKPYVPFIENLSHGILPKHIWQNVTEDEFSFSQFNVLPVGSGLYKIHTVERNSGGIPDYYDLELADNEPGQGPYVSHLIFRFYPSEVDLLEAYSNGEIESMSGISPERAKILKSNGAEILSAPLPRIFGVFFNESQSKVLLDKTVRTALNMSAPRENIVNEVLNGYGTVIDSPLPPGLYSWVGQNIDRASIEERIAAGQELLSKNGWVVNPETGVLEKKSKTDTLTLSFSISTGDTPELKAVAEKLKASWEQLGAKIEIQVYGTGDLNQNVIRPRRYDALLFGEVVGRDADLYPFWHSSQRNDPGLNIALYANSKVDKLLEDARSATDLSKREAAYKAFDQELRNDLPAVFLYSPNFLYVVPEKLHRASLGNLSTPQDRFLGIRDWYIETNRVWQIFIK
jgi:peptide/nickel transport system substrate-binding protein